ncbi:MAG: hypothetical protein IPL01_13920 [Acidobacteria bacterium]|nr:hypothetical protein [Acidobacteriota bacterium]
MEDVKLKGLDLAKFDASQAYRELEQAVKHKAGSVTWNVIHERLGNEVSQMLKGISLVKILATAWSKSSEIQKYRDPVKYPPDKPVYVTLFNHDISSVQKPSLKVVLREAATGFERSFEIPLEIVLKLSMEGVVLELRVASWRPSNQPPARPKARSSFRGWVFTKLRDPIFKLPAITGCVGVRRRLRNNRYVAERMECGGLTPLLLSNFNK